MRTIALHAHNITQTNSRPNNEQNISMPALCYDCYKQQASDAKTDKVQQTDTVEADRRWKIKPTNPTEMEIPTANGRAFEWIFKHASIELVLFSGNARYEWITLNETNSCIASAMA